MRLMLQLENILLNDIYAFVFQKVIEFFFFFWHSWSFHWSLEWVQKSKIWTFQSSYFETFNSFPQKTITILEKIFCLIIYCVRL